MDARQFTMKEALDLHGIKPPAIRKGMSQEEIDEMVEEWKDTELRDHYKRARIEAHPDKHGGTDEATKRFQNLTTAYEEVKEHLKLRRPRVPPEKVTECRACDASRVPSDAAHCHECGLRYETSEPVAACPVCDADRNPPRAKFCHACGYDYQESHPIFERLRNVGFTEPEIEHLVKNGSIDRWKKMSALDPVLQQEIQHAYHFRSLIRRHNPFYG